MSTEGACVEPRIVATGLEFPEGPVALSNGDVIVTEIAAGRLSRVKPNGTVEVLAVTGGGPNGAALGPDGALYVTQNGGFQWHRRPLPDGSMGLFPGEQPADYTGGAIQRVTLAGEVSTLYTECNGIPLKGPNDLVFDREGNFYFTDLGKNRPREKDRTGVYYASPDGKFIREIIFPMEGPNGIGLSPDEKTLYVAQSDPQAAIWKAFEVLPDGTLGKSRVLFDATAWVREGRPGLPDGLAVDQAGHIWATGPGGVYCFTSEGKVLGRLNTGQRTANCKFGDDGQTLFVTADMYLCRVKTRSRGIGY
ncbi:MAG: SMP-30/gluconolactonase/LRE family protein [Dehalococcoidia bacterium]|nr:SMP-30/gluconolactonase/LRE family protein [Dehalococcoidia bacterium]